MSYLTERKRVLVCTDTSLSIVDAPLQTRKAFLQYIVTKGNNVWMHLVTDAKAAGFVTDDDIMLLWQEGILALEDIKGVVPDGRIISLLEEKESLNYHDAYYIFQQWLYRAENFPFSGETLQRWFKKSTIADGKLRSLMMIALYRTSPALICLGDISPSLTTLVHYDPDSHGIHRMLLLALEMAGQDPEKQAVVMDMFVEACEVLFFRNRSTFEFLLRIVKEDARWFVTVRTIGLEQLRNSIAETIAKLQKSMTNI